MASTFGNACSMALIRSGVPDGVLLSGVCRGLDGFGIAALQQ
jgi:hypothetical protein